jgi:hypothetical protein
MAAIARPDIRYSVQALLRCQKKQIYLIDPQSNTYIDGLVNAPALYLTHTPPGLPTQVLRRRMGFAPNPPQELVTVSDEIRVDATLYFSYPDQDIFSGYDQKTGETVMVIQVWHDDEVNTWKKIAQRIASKMVIVRRGIVIPTVFFHVTSAFLPLDPLASHQLIICPSSSDYVDAVSKKTLFPNDWDFEE